MPTRLEAEASAQYKKLLATTVRRAIRDYQTRHKPRVVEGADPLEAFIEATTEWETGSDLAAVSTEFVVAQAPLGTIRRAEVVYARRGGKDSYRKLAIGTHTPSGVDFREDVFDRDLREGKLYLTEEDYSQALIGSGSAHNQRPTIVFAIGKDEHQCDPKADEARIKIRWDGRDATRFGYSSPRLSAQELPGLSVRALPEVITGAYADKIRITATDFAKGRKAANDAVIAARAAIDLRERRRNRSMLYFR